MRYLTLSFFILAYFLCSPLSFAANSQSQLNHIIEKIKNITNILHEKNNKRNDLQKDLNNIETQYGESSKKTQHTQAQIMRQKQKIIALENASLMNHNQSQLQREALAEQLRLFYLLQRQGPVKLLLNGQDVNQIGRLLYYYEYLNRYRVESIQILQANLEHINNDQQQLYTEYQGLQKLQIQQQDEQKNLTSMKINRTQLILSINNNIQDQKQQLNTLSKNKKRLEQTLAALVHLQKTTSPNNFSNAKFATQRGRLPWPTRGSVLHYFNTPIANSEIKWNAEIIEAPDGQPVYSVAPGAVVFSKWLEGYGLLIIINHGDGYMTLYGRNHSLYKHEGDQVVAGALIATVGQSGGYDKPALYFAIRYNAKPLDPNLWCT